MLLVVTLLSRLFGERPLAGVVLGALAVDFLAGRAGAGWSMEPGGRAALLLGAAAGGAAALGAGLAGLLAGQLRPVLWGVDLIGLLTSVLAGIALSFRDELWLRWAPWRLLEAHAPPWLRAAAPVAFGVAASVGEHGLRAGTAVIAAQGALAVALLRRTGSLPAVVASAVALRLLASPTPLGVELRWASGSLASPGVASGPGAWWLAAALAAAALAVGRPGVTPR
jgi:hypothetical protein